MSEDIFFDIQTAPGTPPAWAVKDAVEAMRLIDLLRSQEGDCVTIACDNPDFTGPNSAIDCNGAWTDWNDRRFTGDNLLAALRAAAQTFAALARAR